MNRTIAVTLALLLLTGCQTFAPLVGESPGEAELRAGLRAYEDGRYADASRLLLSSLDAGLARRADRINARKHLAFINCMSGRQRRCQEHFRRALAMDSGFSLGASEIGHPMWGPVFLSVKSEASR